MSDYQLYYMPPINLVTNVGVVFATRYHLLLSLDDSLYSYLLIHDREASGRHLTSEWTRVKERAGRAILADADLIQPLSLLIATGQEINQVIKEIRERDNGNG